MGASLAALAAVGLVTTASAASPGPTRGGDPGGIRTAARAAAVAALAPTVVTLPTGQRIGLSRTAGGAPVTTLLDGKAFAATKAAVGSAVYVIPASVRDVLGSRLDPALFDVAAIAARPGGRTPVTVTYADPSAPTAVPGVEITARSGLTATGYVTPASSRALGAALATTSADRLFARVAGVRVTNPARTPDSRYPMHTVTIKAIGRDGKPAGLSFVGYMGLDPIRGSGGLAITNYKGIAKISVPSGRYTLLDSAFNDDYSQAYLVASPEFNVTGPTTATIDFRAATTPVTTTSFKAIGDSVTDTELARIVNTPDGSVGFFMGMLASSTTRYFVAPTTGSLHGEVVVSQFLAGASPSGVAPYTVAFAGDRSGRIPSTPIRFASTPATTVRLHDAIHGPRDLTRSIMTTVVQNENGGVGFGLPLTSRTPTRYVTATPGTLDGADLYQSIDNDTESIQGWQRQLPLQSTAGTSVDVNWMTAPMHSRFITPTLSPDLALCSACIKDGAVALASLPMSDGDPVHFGNPDVSQGAPQGTYAVLADGAPVTSGTGFLLFAGGAYPAGTKVLSGRQTATRSGGIFSTQTVLTTEFSTPVKAAFPAPKELGCIMGDGCSMLPMLSADYDATVDLDNRLSAGRQAIGLTINQLGRSAPVGITSVKAWVSYDGSTWTRVPVSGSGGHYSATLTVPTAGPGRTTAGLKLTAADQAGSTLSETITGAFLLPR